MQPLLGVAQGTALARLLDCLLQQWPEHVAFVARRFGDTYRSFDAVSEQIAYKIITIAGSSLAEFCSDFRLFCRAMLVEELHFRRTGKYRLRDFASAQRDVYDDAGFM